MAGHGDKSREENLAGIRLILEELRDLKEELRDLKKELAEDRKRADDRWRRLEEFHRKAMAEAEEDRKGIRDALVVIGKVGRRIIQTQEKHTGLLMEIRDLLKHRNGGGGAGPLLKPRSPAPPSRRR